MEKSEIKSEAMELIYCRLKNLYIFQSVIVKAVNNFQYKSLIGH